MRPKHLCRGAFFNLHTYEPNSPVICLYNVISLRLINLVFICILSTLLTACIGVNSIEPLCKHAKKIDIENFSGNYYFQDEGIQQNLHIKRHSQGIYLLDPFTGQWKQKLLAISLCEINGQGIAEYRDYDVSKDRFSEQSYWPHFYENRNNVLKMFFADSSTQQLISHKVPYQILKQDLLAGGIQTSHGFIALNLNAKINQQLVNAMTRSETFPSSLIDYGNRWIHSPMFTRKP